MTIYRIYDSIIIKPPLSSFIPIYNFFRSMMLYYFWEFCANLLLKSFILICCHTSLLNSFFLIFFSSSLLNSILFLILLSAQHHYDGLNILLQLLFQISELFIFFCLIIIHIILAKIIIHYLFTLFFYLYK